MRVDEDVIIEKFDIRNIDYIKENEIIFSTISLSGKVMSLQTKLFLKL